MEWKNSNQLGACVAVTLRRSAPEHSTTFTCNTQLHSACALHAISGVYVMEKHVKRVTFRDYLVTEMSDIIEHFGQG